MTMKKSPFWDAVGDAKLPLAPRPRKLIAPPVAENADAASWPLPPSFTTSNGKFGLVVPTPTLHGVVITVAVPVQVHCASACVPIISDATTIERTVSSEVRLRICQSPL